MKVVFCTAFLHEPLKPMRDALEASLPIIEAAGWEHGWTQEKGNPYISAAYANLTRKALDAKADVIVFLEYDMSWKPENLLTLLETEGDVIAGTYRYKQDVEAYMGALIVGTDNRATRRADGCAKADRVPSGFLKITREAIDKFMEAYPELCFGPHSNPSVDLFNHGAHKRVWYGQDYAFSRRYVECGGEIWISPDLDITHWAGEKPYPGNFNQFMMRQAGGALDPAKAA